MIGDFISICRAGAPPAGESGNLDRAGMKNTEDTGKPCYTLSVNALRSFILFCAFVVCGCGCGRVTTTTVANRLGFSENSVISATLSSSSDISTTKPIPSDRLPELWRAISHDALPKTAVIEPRYHIIMRTQSGDILEIYIDETSEAYFTASNWSSHHHLFRSKHLYDFAVQSFR